MTEMGEFLRQAMRKWTAGVAVVTSEYEGDRHGMTVNSFTSISLEPPLVTVTLALNTRTHALVQKAGFFGVTILSEAQQALSERFAGHSTEQEDRFAGLETLSLKSGVPFLAGGLANLDCKVIYNYDMPNSTLFIGEVLAVKVNDGQPPLIYRNRKYYTLCDEHNPPDR